MSASEKLKALKEEATTQSMLTYHEVLPQIVAVVEAAENVPMWPAAGTKMPRLALHQALAALEEALS